MLYVLITPNGSRRVELLPHEPTSASHPTDKAALGPFETLQGALLATTRHGLTVLEYDALAALYLTSTLLYSSTIEADGAEPVIL